MRNLKVLVACIGLMALVACGSDKKGSKKKDKDKTDGTAVTNTNNGSQNGNGTGGDDENQSTIASYTSHDGVYTASLQRDGENFWVSVSKTSIQNLYLWNKGKGLYRGTTPGVVTPVLDELILTMPSEGQCRIVWKEYGYNTYDRIFQGSCP